jgi:hypothetical protein
MHTCVLGQKLLQASSFWWGACVGITPPINLLSTSVAVHHIPHHLHHVSLMCAQAYTPVHGVPRLRTLLIEGCESLAHVSLRHSALTRLTLSGCR